ncbi:MAG: lysine 5,6-aminomutase subunit alpha TIM-barrel domain-containing protein [Chloroflexota bacterium]
MSAEWGPLDRLTDLASTLAGAWGARARASTTLGQERAMLRLFGVHGLDSGGRPLAGEVVDRFVGGDQSRLGAGIALPFAMALLEYDVSPQQLALDIASGAIDLRLEAELLRQHDRRQVAEEEARRLGAAAIARIDANRTARRELVGLLGDAPRPWIGTTLLSASIDRAVPEATSRMTDGVDVIRVEVPVGRELAVLLMDAGVDLPDVPSVEAIDREAKRRSEDDPAPTGSQRGLAELRHALDEVAAGRRSYVRLATASPALAAPEQSVVASFERVDLVEADPIAEIVAGSVDPDRALADHAFAHRLLRRAGTTVVVGAGPLVVAPDLAAGVPSDPATRAGRALALQLVGVALARGDRIPADHVIVGAVPPWLLEESAAAARAAAEVALRRVLLPDHPLGFDEPVSLPDRAEAWPFVLSGVLPPGTAAALVMRRPPHGEMRSLVNAGRSAVAVGGALAAAFGERKLEGVALEHARGVVTAAIRTLERLGEVGWRSVLGDAPGGGERIRIGADAVAERTDSFDPLAPDLVPIA